MKKIKKNKHPTILETVHETAKGLYDAHIINATTMREFDELCLPKVKEFSPSQIKFIRIHVIKVSQPVFARCLNTTLSTVRQWEQGKKYPRGTSLRLLNIISEKGLGILYSDPNKDEKRENVA